MKKYGTLKEEEQIAILQQIHKSLSHGIRSAKAHVPRRWLEERKLSIEATKACYSSGQLHHRKPQDFKDQLESVGYLTLSHVGANAGQIPYTTFGKNSIVFPLYDPQGAVVNFYAIEMQEEETAYMNTAGLYPGYPHELTKRLYIVNTVMEAATLLESKVLDNKEAVLALHDGRLEEEHRQAIQRLSRLEEIIYIH